MLLSPLDLLLLLSYTVGYDDVTSPALRRISASVTGSPRQWQVLHLLM